MSQSDDSLQPPRLTDSDNPAKASEDDTVWTYRGYKMRPAEFNTAWVHYYRAEIQRSNTWRTRLDATTNWAVLTVAAAISFVLSSPSNHYGVIILDIMLITLFLWIEARRYRYYELWSYRARLIEVNFFAAMLVPPTRPDPTWAERLAGSIREPKFPVSLWEAFGRRLRRNYLWIYFILDGAWALKSYIHPAPAASLSEFLDRSSLGMVPGLLMMGLGLLFNGLLIFLALFTVRLKNASGEVGVGTDAIFHDPPD
jgi:uncharacterized membrane protein